MAETFFDADAELEDIDVVSVLLPLPLAGAYDYAVPGELVVSPGDYVEVPLGPRRVIGVVWGPGSNDVASEKLKPIEQRFSAPAMPESLRRLVDWVADYTLTAPGLVLALTMRARGAFEPPKEVAAFRLGVSEPERLTPARQRVLDVAADGLLRSQRDLAHEAGVTSGVIKGLVKSGALETVMRPVDQAFERPAPDHASPTLSDEQSAAAGRLVEKVCSKSFSVSLLDGVTGSGKTEVYFEAVAEALRQGRQALILLPEIALTLQVFERFTARFGAAPAAWHSGLSQIERRRVWRAVASGEAQVVIGARSALFLPFPDLGLIVVDEEHDQSFKQEDGVIYHARDMAVVRGQLGAFPVVLASATPSLETVTNAQLGKYDWLRLGLRYGAASLPEIITLDMRTAQLSADKFLSATLVDEMTKTFAAGEQAMLFLNRRGYAPLTLCRTCGYRMMSPDSSSWLVEHRFQNLLVCHLTGYSIPKPKKCPECGAEDTLAACGPGVERVYEEVKTHFPEARIEIMSSDTIRGPQEIAELIARMEGGEIDLLIGTQVVAKGHNFPGLTLVGIVDADLGLKGGDLRAAERTYQLLHQVAGRAGRADKPGRVYVQSYMPEHPVMSALLAGERDGFLAQEAVEREILSMPPFGRLVAIVASGRDGPQVETYMRDLARQAPKADGVMVFGPIPAPIAVVRGRHRHRFLLKAARDFNIQAYVRTWLEPIKVPNSVRVNVDVDPYSFL